MHLNMRKEKPVVHHYGAAFRTFVKQLALPWNRYQLDNLTLFAGAFLERRSLPVRRLARTLAGPGKSLRAPDKRLRRFLGNRQLDMDAELACLVSFVLARLGEVSFVPVMLDWTFVKGQAILWAQIPYRGRSLPLVASVQNTHLEDDEEGRTQAEQALLKRLRRAWPATAPPPLLLADRGFARCGLLVWLREQNWLFLIRGRMGTYVYDGVGPAATELYDFLQPAPGEVIVRPDVYYGKAERVPLHLVACAMLDPATGKPARWWLLTNLPQEQLPQTPRLYAQRMQPEGTHRDSKRGHAVAGFALSHLARLRQDRLERLVCLLSLVICFLVLVAETKRQERQWLCEQHWGLSLVTFGLDLLHAAGVAARRLALQACASVTLQPLWLQGGYS
jgi:hypothetical protein